jgi:putative heme iron utilization protein
MSDTEPRDGRAVGLGVEAPSLAEQARTLVHASRTGVLATHSQRLVGFPFGSVMPYAPDAEGAAILLISRLAMHARNLESDPRASLLVAPELGGAASLAAARVTLLGRVEPIPEGDTARLREAYLERNPEARTWVDFADFRFHRLAPLDLYFVGGFGAMGWIDPDSYRAAEPDPLSDAAPGILDHMNEDHADALVLYCRRYAGVEAAAATMTGVDRLGFRVRARVGEEEQDLRINYPRQVRTPEETRIVLVEMVREARGAAAAR